MGFCVKEIIQKNKYFFDKFNRKINRKKNQTLGYYTINTNNNLYNCNNLSQCKEIKYISLSNKNTTIECLLCPAKNELAFKINNDKEFKFIDVRPFQYEYFSPCIICFSDISIEINFNY